LPWARRKAHQGQTHSSQLVQRRSRGSASAQPWASRLASMGFATRAARPAPLETSRAGPRASDSQYAGLLACSASSDVLAKVHPRMQRARELSFTEIASTGIALTSSTQAESPAPPGPWPSPRDAVAAPTSRGRLPTQKRPVILPHQRRATAATAPTPSLPLYPQHQTRTKGQGMLQRSAQVA